MKKTIKILLLTIFCVFAISIISNVKAASASITASKNPVTVGDSVTINVNINAAAWNLKASGTGISAKSWADSTDDANNASRTETLTLDTSTTGSKTITLSGDVTDGDTGATTTINTAVTVVVNEKEANNTTTQQSSDATLKSVTINGSNYSLGTTRTVSADTSSVTIKATPNSSKATVAGTGTKELVTGTNKFTITVTAENGSKKSYTITIVREEAVDDNPNIIEPNEEEGELRLISIQIEGIELTPEFNEEIFEYFISVTNLEAIKISAISNMEDASIEIKGNTELKEGENVVLIKVTRGEKETEYKITVNKIVEVVSEPQEEIGNNNEEGFWSTTKGKIAIGVIVGAIVLGIISICIWKAKTGDDTLGGARREARRRSSYDDFDD